MIGVGAFLAFFNALLLGWGSNTWGSGALATGLCFAALIIPVFCYRHYIQDKGVFPASMYHDSDAEAGSVVGSVASVDASGAPVKRAGMLPYVVLLGGAATVAIGQLLAGAAQ
jgi:hypothetical protein